MGSNDFSNRNKKFDLLNFKITKNEPHKAHPLCMKLGEEHRSNSASYHLEISTNNAKNNITASESTN